MSTLEQEITLEKKGKIALITLNREKKLNALDSDLYYRLAMLMNEVAAMPEITITVLTGKGRFFSAYVYLDSLLPIPSDSTASLLIHKLTNNHTTEAQT
jgi:enoyl-CoA hydratase/carnithine racemase